MRWVSAHLSSLCATSTSVLPQLLGLGGRKDREEKEKARGGGFEASLWDVSAHKWLSLSPNGT